MSKVSLLALFVSVDDFCVAYQNYVHSLQLEGQIGQRPGPKPRLSLSEVMTIIIHFHQSGYREFKHFYQKEVLKHLRSEFPNLVSYNRFVELMPATLIPMCLYLQSQFGQTKGVAFIDSTRLVVCHNKRIKRHKVFADVAARGKSSMGWFYGFKLHLIINDQGEIITFYLTPGNVDDRKPVPHMTRQLWGKLFADKGYIAQALFEDLLERGVQLITPIRKNMQNRLMPLMDKLLLRKRSLIETVNDQLKNISQIDHSRHRSLNNFMVNLVAALIAYTLQPKKPSLNLSHEQVALLPALI
jgi:transposase